ncbi:transketolase-like TK C-terminal-containing protein [Klebsiella pneumoniae]|uniref:transketolase-like TK C-terminal-containing protein n=1 Tax=Klebsiella pneumoniae TaxID=573 RepID=UPI00397646BB
MSGKRYPEEFKIEAVKQVVDRGHSVSSVSVLPKAVTARVAVEAGIADYWFKYVGLNGAIVGMTTFGESAPAEQLFEEYGFTVDNVVAKAKALL